MFASKGQIGRKASAFSLTASWIARVRATLDANCGYVIAFFLASRLWLEAIGILTQTLIQPYLNVDHGPVYSSHPWLSIWGVWDTGWYVGLASHGYDAEPLAAGALVGQANWAFFPAYPMISALLSDLTGLPLFPAMVILSNICFLSALLLIRRETEEEFGRPAARVTVALLCVMPGSYVFSSAYSESLFLLAIATVLMLVRRRLWLAAGIAAGAATLTRNVGIGLALPILFAGWQDLLGILPRTWTRTPGRADLANGKAGLRIVAAMSIPACASLGFCGFLYLRTGDPLAFISVQHAWHRTIFFPPITLLIPVVFPGWLLSRYGVNFLFAWLSVAMLVPLALWKRWALLALGVFLVLVPLSAGPESYTRYTLTMLPVIMAAGALCAAHPRAAAIAIPALATVNGFMMVGWTLGLPFTI